VTDGPADPDGPGSRPDLVLVHGLGSAASYWDNIGPALAADFTLHTPNLPGHGPGAGPVPHGRAHPAAIARGMVEQFESDGIERPHLVGLSLGGWVVLEMAALGFGASVVALAPAGMWEVGVIGQDRRERAIRHPLGPMLGVMPYLARVGALRSLVLEPVLTHPERVSAKQFIDAATALAQARGYRALDRALVRDRFTDGRRITVPVTVAFGDNDHVLPPDVAQNFSELPAQADIETVASCGHAMTFDQPERCLELIARTVARA
jgi:pimeloyl-ACP methyl ester carboxylesterase